MMLVLWNIWAILGKAKFVEQWAVVVNVYWAGNVNPICADVNPIKAHFLWFLCRDLDSVTTVHAWVGLLRHLSVR